MRSKNQLVAMQVDEQGNVVAVLDEAVGYTVKDAEAWLKKSKVIGAVKFFRPVCQLELATKTTTHVKRA